MHDKSIHLSSCYYSNDYDYDDDNNAVQIQIPRLL